MLLLWSSRLSLWLFEPIRDSSKPSQTFHVGKMNAAFLVSAIHHAYSPLPEPCSLPLGKQPVRPR